LLQLQAQQQALLSNEVEPVIAPATRKTTAAPTTLPAGTLISPQARSTAPAGNIIASSAAASTAPTAGTSQACTAAQIKQGAAGCSSSSSTQQQRTSSNITASSSNSSAASAALWATAYGKNTTSNSIANASSDPQALALQQAERQALLSFKAATTNWAEVAEANNFTGEGQAGLRLVCVAAESCDVASRQKLGSS
jgi:hypothetical protein